MPTALKIKKELEEQINNVEKYRKSSSEKAAYDAATERLEFLKEHRRNSGIEEIWKAADKAYIPHKITTKKGKSVLVSDDELGWRSTPVNLNVEDNWQEESVPPNAYIKIQTALGIIVDRNPKAVFEPGAKQFEKNTTLMKNLYERSWDIAMSKDSALKPFVFNCAKYGTGYGRTFPLEITRDVRDLQIYNAEDPKKNKYSEKSHTYFDDVFRESLSPWQVWLDDATIVGNPFSTNDVIFYKDYDWLKLKNQFGHLKNFKFIKPELKVLTEDNEMKSYDAGNDTGKSAKYQERVWFWENLEMDLFFVWTESGIVLVNEPMPQSPKNKRLSIWYAPWTMRDDKTHQGIGIYEAMRNDHQLYTKYRNMTADQMVASIYREFFYSGTDTLEGDGQMKMRPGKGRQVSDAKNIKWNEVPSPGIEAWDAQDRQMARIDDVTGISKSLQGEITGSTAFEISQARESALKRMKTPLENITHALEIDGYISCGIIEDLYSVPKIKLLSRDIYIQPFELDMYETEDGGRLQEGEHYTKHYREVPLNLERDEAGGVKKTEAKNFFVLKEEDFPWEGVIKIKGQSIIADSELLERTTTVEMANLVVPLFQMPREISEKPAREIIKSYNKDPEDWVPEMWMTPPVPVAPAGPIQPELFTDPAMAEEPQEIKPVVAKTDANSAAKNLVKSLSGIGK
jgi:hypothetical protein